MRQKHRCGGAFALPKQNAPPHGGALFIPFRVLSLAQQIVDGYVIEVSKSNQDIGGDVTLPQFVVAIGPLGTIQIFRKLSLF